MESSFKKLPETTASNSKQRLSEIVEECEKKELGIVDFYILNGARQDHRFQDLISCRQFEDGFEAIYRNGMRGFILSYPENEPTVLLVYEKKLE